MTTLSDINFFRPRGDSWTFSVPFVDTSGAAYDFSGIGNVSPMGVLYLFPLQALSPYTLDIIDITSGVVTFRASESVTKNAVADALPLNADSIAPLPNRLHIYTIDAYGRRTTRRVLSILSWDPATVNEAFFPLFVDTASTAIEITLPVFVPINLSAISGMLGYQRAGALAYGLI